METLHKISINITLNFDIFVVILDLYTQFFRTNWIAWFYLLQKRNSVAGQC